MLYPIRKDQVFVYILLTKYNKANAKGF